MTRVLCLLLAAVFMVSCTDDSVDPLCEDRYYVLIYHSGGNIGDKTVIAGDSTKLIGVLISGDRYSDRQGCGRYLYSSSTRPEEFTWSSTDTTIVRVSPTGQTSGVSVGTVRVRVRHGEQFDEVSVMVRKE